MVRTNFDYFFNGFGILSVAVILVTAIGIAAVTQPWFRDHFDSERELFFETRTPTLGAKLLFAWHIVGETMAVLVSELGQKLRDTESGTSIVTTVAQRLASPIQIDRTARRRASAALVCGVSAVAMTVYGLVDKSEQTKVTPPAEELRPVLVAENPAHNVVVSGFSLLAEVDASVRRQQLHTQNVDGFEEKDLAKAAMAAASGALFGW